MYQRHNRGNKTPSRTSPRPGSKRGCLCANGTYSVGCCDGSLQAQGIGRIDALLYVDYDCWVRSAGFEYQTVILDTYGDLTGVVLADDIFEIIKDDVIINTSTVVATTFANGTQVKSIDELTVQASATFRHYKT